ncbi:hypothetical protein [Aeromonas schubertii]|uniref:hypothetical protein n=1 Tax=Aeromonas schubertii TaxID=652 RepID=UPI0010A7C9E4|nr:hypothetical protein [Aeromonas schubertii]QCG47283.1 hypothetical protein E2P79_04935 [Aeromonas schubertii]
MRYLIFLFISALVLLSSFIYVKKYLTKEGEYQASLYFIGSEISSVHIVTNIRDSGFVAHSYLKSAALSEAATFVSKGYFIDDDKNGNYWFHYTIEESHTPVILDPGKARFYMGMVGRVGLPHKEKIKLIFHNKEISIFDMKRNKNIIMYMKKH